VTARSATQIALGVVIATMTGITSNLATADGASPWMWLAVVAITCAGVAVAIWAAQPPTDPGGPSTANGASGPHTNITMYGGNVVGTVGTHVQHAQAPRPRFLTTWLVLTALATGLVVGLVARPGGQAVLDPVPPTVIPSPVVPTTVEATPTTETPTTETPADPPLPTSRRRAPTPTADVEPPEPLAGSWLSLDRTFETLHLYSDGTYRWEDPPTADKTGRYQVDGSQITFTGGAADQAFTWSVRDALLTLTDDTGARRLYTRN